MGGSAGRPVRRRGGLSLYRPQWRAASWSEATTASGDAGEGSDTEAASSIWEDRTRSCTGLRSPELRVDETWEGDKGRRKQAWRSSAAHGCDLRSERERGSAGAGALARAGPPTWSCPGGESEVEVSWQLSGRATLAQAGIQPVTRC